MPSLLQIRVRRVQNKSYILHNMVISCFLVDYSMFIFYVLFPLIKATSKHLSGVEKKNRIRQWVPTYHVHLFFFFSSIITIFIFILLC